MSFVFTSVDSLIDQIRAHRSNVNVPLLRAAYAFGMEAHAAHMRQGGDPYFTHPIAVAEILITWGLDDATIAAAFLHDTVEDVAEITLKDLTDRFGAEVAELVDGVTKLEELEDAREDSHALDFSLDPADPKRRKQAEDLRKLLIAMSRDPRVLLIKLADRLHNARTFDGMPLAKQQRKAKETMDIYAPMAGRMGMQTVREALEDICFKILHPTARRQILKDFVRLRRKHGDAPIEETIAQLQDLMRETSLEADVTGRRKMPFSIWSKMHVRRISFDKLSDVAGFRILVNDVADCYKALGAVHQRWPMAPDRFKDYISVPKPNGYRSIHTTILDDAKRRIEIQIRTRDMHRLAEQGAAAHWSYRDGVEAVTPDEAQTRRFYGWLRDMVEKSGDGDEDAIDFVERARAEMHVDQIYCLTPKGDVIHLPRGATPLDFAYAVHTEIGERCYSAEVDGRPVQLFTTLRHGQTVKILQSKSVQPTLDMAPLVKTPRARAGIKRAVKAREQRDHAAAGRRVVESAFTAAGAKLTESAAAAAARALKFKNAEQMFACVWRVNLNADMPDPPKGPTALDVLKVVDPAKAAQTERARAAAPDDQPPVHADKHYVSNLLHGATWRYCRGCMPIPGDRLYGLRAPARRRMTIHRPECPDVAGDEDNADKWVYAHWSPGEELRGAHLARLTTELTHQPGALGRMCQVIGEMGCNIDDLRFTARRHDYYQIDVVLTVRDLKHLFAVQHALEAESVVLEAARAEPRGDDTES